MNVKKKHENVCKITKMKKQMIRSTPKSELIFQCKLEHKKYQATTDYLKEQQHENDHFLFWNENKSKCLLMVMNEKLREINYGVRFF